MDYGEFGFVKVAATVPPVALAEIAAPRTTGCWWSAPWHLADGRR